jgi:4-hydroxy-2-oxoheptanedioate aldolase
MTRESRLNQLLEKARGGQRVMGVLSHLRSPGLVEAFGWFGLDFVVLDHEHTAVNSESIEHLMRAAEIGGTVPFVRLERPDPYVARRMVDMGAAGVLVPTIESPAQLREMIEAVKFPPFGKRTFCAVPRVNLNGAGDMMSYIDQATRMPFIIPTIATPEGVNCLDELLAFEECVMFQPAPFDLAMQQGYHPLESDGYAEALRVHEALCKKIRAAGKLVMGGIVSLTAGIPQDQFNDVEGRMGCDLAFYPEMVYLRAGVAEARRLMDGLNDTLRERAAAGEARRGAG